MTKDSTIITLMGIGELWKKKAIKKKERKKIYLYNK